MPATVNYEVKISGGKAPSRQPVRAVQNGWVSAEHPGPMDYGARFSDEGQFSEEQLIAGKSESPTSISGPFFF